MMPLLKGIHDGQKFFVMNFIVNLGMRKLTRIKTNWMKNIILSGL
jgi:hypothetical protein